QLPGNVIHLFGAAQPPPGDTPPMPPPPPPPHVAQVWEASSRVMTRSESRRCASVVFMRRIIASQQFRIVTVRSENDRRDSKQRSEEGALGILPVLVFFEFFVGHAGMSEIVGVPAREG